MRVLASILCATGMAAAAALPAFAQHGAQWAGSRATAIVGRPSAAFRPAPHIYQPAPHIYPSAPMRGPIVEPEVAGPFHAPVMSRAYPRTAYPRTNDSEGGGRHDWRRRGHRRQDYGSNQWGRGGYQVPYFYSYSTYYVPSFWYPGLNSFDSFFNTDDYDAFFNEQPQGQAYPAGYGSWSNQYSDGVAGPEVPIASTMPPLMNDAYREPYQGDAGGGFRQAPAVAAAPPPPEIKPQAQAQRAAIAEPEPQPATTLIFKDGRPAEKVYSYVITPTTIYSFHGNRRDEIPVAAINIQATRAANRAAGVDFSIPSSTD